MVLVKLDARFGIRDTGYMIATGFVIPAKAGIQKNEWSTELLIDSHFE
jgi:hypothetical protein